MTESGSLRGSPLYLRVKDLLMKEIQHGAYPVGTKLPKEQDLCRKFNVSRITIRKAVEELQNEGYVHKQQGKGTFVTKQQRLNVALLDVSGFRDEYFQDGRRGNPIGSHSRIIRKKIIPAAEDIASWLQIPTGSEVFFLQRVFSFPSGPYMIDNAWFPCSLYPGIFDLIEDDVSTFSVMYSHYGYQFHKVYKELTTSLTTSAEAKILNCPTGSPLFCTKKLIWGKQGIPIHFSKFLVRSDNIIYTLTIEDPDSKVKS